MKAKRSKQPALHVVPRWSARDGRRRLNRSRDRASGFVDGYCLRAYVFVLVAGSLTGGTYTSADDSD